MQLARREQFPILPQLAIAVLRIAANRDGSARGLEAVMDKDPALAARVLKVANSAYYGMPKKVRSINGAVQLLGMRTLQSIIISVAYHQAIDGTGMTSQFDRLAFWRHSLAVASIARTLASSVNAEVAEELYTIGLLHDVGMLVLATLHPDDFEKVLTVSRLGIVPQELVESHIFGFDSCEVGAVLADKWAFGQLAEDAIRWHLKADQVCAHPQTTGIISLANALAHEAGMVNQSGPYPVMPERCAVEASGLNPAKLEALRKDIGQIIVSAEETYRIHPPKAA